MKKNYLKIKLKKNFLFTIAFAILFFGNFQISSAQDMGAIALVDPTSPMCATGSQTVVVTIMNYDAATIDFSINSVTVAVNVTGASTQTFTGAVNTGTLAAGATQDVTITNAAIMTVSGVHNFDALTILIGDADNTNDAMPTANITVNPLPIVNIGPDSTQCGGTIVLDAGNPGATYVWSNLDVTQTTTVSTSGTYYVDVIDANSCAGSDTVIITINTVPTLTVTGNTTICGSGSTILTASGAATYTWSANAASATTATVTVSPVTTDTYTVTGDNLGCTATKTVIVNVSTTPTVAVVASNTIVCSGTAVTFTASGATTYTWSANAGSVTTATATTSPVSNTTYTVTGDNSGCTSAQTVSINTKNGPVVTTSVTAASCPTNNNGSATAIATGTGSLTYTWMPGGLNTATISGLTPNVYTVTVVDGSACPTIATATISNPAGGLQTTFAAGNGQAGNMFNITATNTSFITSFDCHLDTLTAGSANDSVKIYFIPSTYVGQSGTPSAWTYVGGAHVTSAGIGVPTVVPISVNHTIPAGQTHGFYITRKTGMSLKYTNGLTFGAVYASNADFAIKEGNGVAYPFGTIFPTTGTGSRVWNGIVHFCNTVGVEQQLSTVISSEIYPQPVVDNATIKITGLNTPGTITLKVFDAMGKLVKETSSSNTEEIKVNRDNMNDGMYFYNVYNEDHKIVCKGKFMVQ